MPDDVSPGRPAQRTVEENSDAILKLFSGHPDFLTFTSSYDFSVPDKKQIEFDHTRVTLVDAGVLCIEPKNPTATTEDFVISSGIHGDETAPIEIVNQLINEILCGDTKVKNRMLFVIGNPVAMKMGERFKDENLNRLFCGKYQLAAGTYEGKRAEALERHLNRFFADGQGSRFHYDLHTAIRRSRFEKFAVYPFQHEKPWNKRQLEFLHACEINTVLLSHAPSATFSYYASHVLNAHAFTIELGQAKPFGENDMKKFTALTTNLRRLIQAEKIGTTAFSNDNFNLFRVLTELIRTSDQFVLHVADDEKNFSRFPKGTLLCEDREHNYTTQLEGESIVFPNATVKPGQRAALVVIPTTIDT